MVASSLLKSSKLSITSLQCLKNVKTMTQCRTFTNKLTEQQLAVQTMARDFANEHLKPIASKLDQEGRFPFDPDKTKSVGAASS